MTAVEWLIQQLRNGKELNDNLIQQAKEMEKEQIKDAYDAGIWDVGCKAPNFDEYYKVTFKSE